MTESPKMTIAALFAGIGGLEKGLAASGLETQLFCEIDEGAKAVLGANYPIVKLHSDIRTHKNLPKVEIVTAGFPCQDLSMAGRKRGIKGIKSSVVEHLFRLLHLPRKSLPRWILIENVPYMLHLGSGGAMHMLTSELEKLGYTWAYRVVDVRAFGIPQRRQRIVLLASKVEDPRDVLFADNVDVPPVDDRSRHVSQDSLYGFYWTEGLRGLGWVHDAVPPIKGGSGLGIPSPPAVWSPQTGHIGTIDIRDAERLQGFPVDWTLPALKAGNGKVGIRWRLIGNAVCVSASKWIGMRLANPGKRLTGKDKKFEKGEWPRAAWGHNGEVFSVQLSDWPVAWQMTPLKKFLQYPLKPLSAKATEGFYSRARASRIHFVDGFLDDVGAHGVRMKAGGQL